MSILITGDTHGENSIQRLNNHNVKKANDGKFPRHIVIAGDFGLIWNQNPYNRLERHWLDWLDEKPWETIVILGNHENYERIYKLPVVERYGAPVFRCSQKVFILQHGRIYDIEGTKFFVFGGAESIDKAFRQDRISWWQEEIPTQEDCQRAHDSLASVNGVVDYVVSHTAPREAVSFLASPTMHPDKYNDPTTLMLDEISAQITACKAWLFGHFHCNQTFSGPVTSRKYVAVYDQFYSCNQE